MIQIVEAVPEDHCEINNRAIQQLYAFALNRLQITSYLTYSTFFFCLR